MAEGTRVFLAIPSMGIWDDEFGMSLLAAVLTFVKSGAGLLLLDKKRGSLLPRMRHQFVRTAQKRKATHLLFIDTDQTFPPITIGRLLSHGKPVVACNVATKHFPAATSARNLGENSYGQLVHTLASSKGLEKVWRVGTGIMMIEMSVFEKIPPPWFPVTYQPHRDDYQGEDWGFCQQCEEHGIDILIDQDLSKDVGHRGMIEYTLDLVPPPIVMPATPREVGFWSKQAKEEPCPSNLLTNGD